MKKLFLTLFYVSAYSHAYACQGSYDNLNIPLPNAIDAIKNTGPIYRWNLDPSDRPTLDLDPETVCVGSLMMAIEVGIISILGILAADIQTSRASYTDKRIFYKNHLYPYQVGYTTAGILAALSAIIHAKNAYNKVGMIECTFPSEDHTRLSIILKHRDPEALKDALQFHYGYCPTILYSIREDLRSLSRRLGEYQMIYQRTGKTCYNTLIAIIKANIYLVNRAASIVEHATCSKPV